MDLNISRRYWRYPAAAAHLADFTFHRHRVAVFEPESRRVFLIHQDVVSIRARERVVTFKISGDVFLDLVRQSPEISMQVMTSLARQVERSSALLQQHQSHS